VKLRLCKSFVNLLLSCYEVMDFCFIVSGTRYTSCLGGLYGGKEIGRRSRDKRFLLSESSLLLSNNNFLFFFVFFVFLDVTRCHIILL
jgi:hypothetical protein